MHGVDDDAGKPRRIEQPLLQVEFPRAVLLRHQTALQPVGEPRHHALQVGELLVEISAQAVEFLGLAQVFGGNDFVEPGDERLVVGTARFVLAPLARPPRLGRALRIAHFGIVRHISGRRVGGLSGAVGQILGCRLRLLEAHALAVFGLRGIALLALLLLTSVLAVLVALVLVVFVAAVVAHVERIEKIVDRISESALVLDHVLEAVEVAASTPLDPAPPQLDDTPRRGRRRLTREALAHQHGKRLFDRRIGPISDLVEFAAMELIVEHRCKIFGDALHASRPDRLDPGLFDRFENGAPLLACWQQAAVDRVVMTRHPQCDCIRMTAYDRSVAGRQLARRLRQARLARSDAGPLGRERNLKLRPPRDRSQAPGHGALERLIRGLLGQVLGFDVRGHGYRRLYFPIGRAYVAIPPEDNAIAEPENHTLRLLPEIHAAIGAMDNQIDRNQEELEKRIDSLRQDMLGESVPSRYATAEFDERFSALEWRVSALESRG